MGDDQARSAARDALERELATLRAKVADLQRAAARHRDDGGDDGPSLAAREELLREAERLAHLGTWTWEPESGRVTWSSEMYRILGLDPDEVEASVEAFYRMVHPEDLPRALENHDNQTRDGVLPLTELRIVRPDGSIRHTTTTSVILFDDEGVQRKVVGGLLDRTESLAVERRLRRTLTLLEEAQRSAKLGSWRFDPKRGQIEWSQEFRRILGLSPDTPPDPELFRDRFPLAQQDMVKRNHERLMAGKPLPGELSGETQLTRPDGEVRHVRLETYTAPAIDGGVELRGTILDITDDVRLRRELVKAQKTEAIGRLAGGIAHDFNNLLMVISGNLQVMQEELGPRQELFDAMQALDSAAGLTQRLLALGRKAPLERAPIDVNQLLRSTTTMLHRLVGDHVQLRLALEDHLPTVSVDKVEIERALVNLVVNARDAMPDGGSVVVSSARSDLAGSPAVAIAVTDDGPGVPEADLPHLFEPFFTTRSGSGGTGLGLATVLGTAEQHGGTVHVGSAASGGTVFTILLPVTDDAGPVAVPLHREGLPQTTRPHLCVLVVDDDHAVAKVTTRLLADSGFEVLSATTADEALSAWRERGDGIDLVLCDVALGATRGPVLMERLSELGPEPRVLFITGYSEEAAQTQLGHPVLTKPYSLDALLAAIDRAMDR